MSMMEILGQTNGRTSYGRTPIWRMSVGGVPLEVNVQSADLSFGEDRHDTVKMTVSSPDRTTTEGLLEQTVTFLYGISAKTEVFCGYITEVAEVQNETGVLTWRMEMVGPTKPMQTGRPRFWTQRTIPSAVENLAYFSFLGYIGHDSTFLWKALAQTDTSDWKMAVSLAQRLGWSVFNRYGVVMLYDPLVLFLTEGPLVTLISETYTLAKSSFNDERTLLEFDPTEESESSPNQQGVQIAYFNGESVQVAKQVGQHSTYRFLNDYVIRTAEEAALYVNSEESNSSNWRQTAKARIMGNANIFPGTCVDVLTTNKNYYPGKFNGRWFVRAVHHKMDKQTFQTNLLLARPSNTQLVYVGAYRPFWQSTTRPRPELSFATEAGGWMSSWTNSTVRGVV